MGMIALEAIINKSVLEQSESPKEMTELFSSCHDEPADFRNAVDLFCIFMGARSTLYTFMNHVNDSNYDFLTVKKICCQTVSALTNKKIVNRLLPETSELLKSELIELEDINISEMFYNNISHVQHYIAQIFLWLDSYLPWKELCDSYARAKGDPSPDL